MRRILLLLVAASILALPAAAAARQDQQHATGFLVVRNAQTDAGVAGSPVATVVVEGFVIGRVQGEGKVKVYRLSGAAQPQASGVDLTRHAVTYRRPDALVKGTEFDGSGFRFRAVGGVWRIRVFGAGISLYAGGQGKAWLHGSVSTPTQDGGYSVDGKPFSSLPSGVVKLKLGAR